jgi:hypothetical protein
MHVPIFCVSNKGRTYILFCSCRVKLLDKKAVACALRTGQDVNGLCRSKQKKVIFIFITGPRPYPSTAEPFTASLIFLRYGHHARRVHNFSFLECIASVL